MELKDAENFLKLAKSGDDFNLKTHPPSMNILTAKAFNNLIKTKKRQVIAFGGQSGSGKSYNLAKSLQMLSSLYKDNSLGAKIIASNDILCAFGNAKTLNNDNASRYGTYYKLEINNKQIVGG